ALAESRIEDAEPRPRQQVVAVLRAPGEEVVDRHPLRALVEEGLTEARSEEAGAAEDDGPLARKTSRGFAHTVSRRGARPWSTGPGAVRDTSRGPCRSPRGCTRRDRKSVV